ncbi:MAG TPA: arsenite methyltransferase [Bacteroidia bacterium]|jgi:arsenite methyltransferase|nr:arsenite methyltransferase [Bacteroidia bacterium]
METSENLKQLVKEKYSEIATQSKEENSSSCCGSGCCSDEVYNIMNDDYSNLKGYNPDADLGLGCGLPTQYADMKKGDTVIDLGSGAGNDCFIARSVVGNEGKVIGIDMTEAMIAKARANADKLGLNDVEFRLGEIENLPVAGNLADVIVSNCVLNLVPDKHKAFEEILRVLKKGGHFSISDIVLMGDLPATIKKAGEMYAGCVAGALQKEEYMEIIRKAGFINIKIQKEKPILIPDDILGKYLTKDELTEYKKKEAGIFSITVYAEKSKECCDSNCCK